MLNDNSATANKPTANIAKIIPRLPKASFSTTTTNNNNNYYYYYKFFQILIYVGSQCSLNLVVKNQNHSISNNNNNNNKQLI